MYSSDYKKEQGQEVLQTNGKEKHDNTKESGIPQIIHEHTADEQKYSNRLSKPKLKFEITKRRRRDFQTRSRKR